MDDFRMTINKDTQVCMSLSARQGNFGTRLHNYLYAHLGLNYVYKSFTTRDLKSAVGGIRALGIRGCAVSMPFKEEVMEYLDRIEPSAERIHAVNTILNDAGVLTGLNTDYIAIQRVFAENRIPLGAKISVIGSGGMAKAIASALEDLGYRQVTITARNEQTGKALAEKYGYCWQPGWSDGEAYDVLVNATPVGMAPETAQCPCAESLIQNASFVVDSVAIPIQTEFIQAAERLGKTVVTGFTITVIQSVEQFRLYTGVTPEEALIQAAKEYILSFER